MTDPFSRLSCPLCGTPLHREGGSLLCARPEKRHCFDLAGSGYVNLLPPGKAGNAHTGDDAEMIRARSAFLSLGLYDGISDGAARVAAPFLRNRPEILLADGGCGEGYHTCRIARALGETLSCSVTALGFDASKRGAEAGAKLARRQGLTLGSVCAGFAAGNLFALPLPAGGTDCVLSLFAPIAGEEFRRILRDDGVLVVGASGKRHLWELRELLYDAPRESEGEIRTPEGFAQAAEEIVRYTAHVPHQAALQNLFRMTPFAWRTPQEGIRRLETAESLDVTVEVLFRVYRKL